MLFPCLVLLVLLAEMMFILGAAEYASTSFYQRYKQYPEYCSTPQHMENRRIPPLQPLNTSSSKSIGETRLIHVTAVIRHGARTPWSAQMKCWEGYWQDPATGVWDCDLTTHMALPQKKDQGGGDAAATAAATCLFEKRYDALMPPTPEVSNDFNGTCQMGQLLAQGYEQQVQNGKILREAYGYTEGGNGGHDERMRLIDLSLQDSVPWHPELLYFRSDDDQRTVMSGQVLLRSLFDAEMEQQYKKTQQYPIIPLHIADRARDIVGANDHDCPRLDQIQADAKQSADYQDFENSQNSQDVRNYMMNQMNMGPATRNSILDCLMCTMCTDRPLPDAINDYDGTGDSWFTKLAEYDIQTYTKLMKYNDSEYAKLALGPLWYEIVQNIHPYLDAAPDTSPNDIKAPKLALFSGHDTTIMPLLASLGTALWKDTDWAPYAALMTIELHELIDGQSDATLYNSTFAFRLVYDGKVLTPLVEGCPDNMDLCDIVHFRSKIDPIALRNADCSVSDDFRKPGEGDVLVGGWLSSALSTNRGIIVMVAILVLGSGLCGSLLTYFCMKKQLAKYSGRNKVAYNGAFSIDDDDNDGIELPEGDFEDEPVTIE